MENKDKLTLKTHYIKDLSFENPNYSFFYGSKERFHIEKFNFKINSKLVSKNVFEIYKKIILFMQECSVN